MTARTLIQLDTDSRCSVFDSMVAIDSGIDFLLPQPGVTADNVEPLVHGAMFTRGPGQLSNTALFVGGSVVEEGERLLARIRETFFGPLRCSVMLDSNGCNTTASAAVICVARHIELAGCRVLILGGTGPVGLRAARLLGGEGASVVLTSRSLDKAVQAAAKVVAGNSEKDDAGPLDVTGTRLGHAGELASLLDGVDVVLATGAAGVCLWPSECWSEQQSVRVAVDLNAVPPQGIEAVEATDKAHDRNGTLCYGAIGVGGLKMKIHRRAIESMFEANDRVLDTAEIFRLGQAIEAAGTP